MSIDLAVWEGERPSSDADAAEIFAELYSRYVESDDPVPPTEAIARYVNTLLARWPDWVDDHSAASSPWADSPLIGDASGPLFYVAIANNAAARDAWRYAVEAAQAQELVSFDPQSERFARPEY